MNVKELREALAELPDDLRVVVRGYEGGVADVGKLRRFDVLLDVNAEWYYGPHEETNEYLPGRYPDAVIAPVVEIAE